jgi:nitrate reductase cytochrome c-type subunit
LNCATCHNDLASFTRFEVTQVKFPSGSILSFPDSADSNVCMACHQGRESKTSMDRAIAASDLGPDEVASEDKALAFRNPHYFATASTLFGTEAKGAYEIDGQSYNGRFTHTQAFDTCIECHDPHALTVNVEGCAGCHGTAGVEDLQNIRMEQTPVDYDGDGDTTEGIAGEVAGMQEALYAALQAYAADTAGTALIYSDSAYPYFFADANANGTIDEGEGAFTAWTPNLLRGAYNYQWVSKDPGAFAHNGKYILQVLYDSLQVVGGDVGAMTRPEVKAPAAAATPTP